MMRLKEPLRRLTKKEDPTKEDPYKFLNRICDNIKAIEEEDEAVGFFESEEWEHTVYDDPNRTPLY